MCDGQPKCPVLAMYLHGNTIFLDDRLDVHGNDYHTSILLHELIHYVQQQSGRFREGDCDSWVKEEQEAFRIQAAWLRERTIFFPQHHQIPRREHLNAGRSEEHTSELQSQSNLVCRLLLEKKKKKRRKHVCARTDRNRTDMGQERVQTG